jgi:hypothetical protein
MFRLQLHPSSSDLFFGVALVTFWALLWLWFFAQLPRPAQSGDERATAVTRIATAHPTETGERPR